MRKDFERALEKFHDAGVRQFGDDWIPMLARRRRILEGAYQALSEQDRDPISYSSLCAQTSYIFAYAPTRAEYTRQFLHRHREAFGKSLFSSSTVNVVSFGGGPASELVGLIRYLESDEANEPVQSINFNVYDKDANWAEVASIILHGLDTDIKITVNYEEVDAAYRNGMDRIDLSDVDFVIFSYLMSELAKLSKKDQIAENFRAVLSKLKTGAKILFIDNRHRIFIKYFQSCKFVPNLIEKNDDGNPVTCDFSEMDGVFQRLSEALDWMPRTDLNSVSKLIVQR